MATRFRTVLQFPSWNLRFHDVCRAYKVPHVCLLGSRVRRRLTCNRTTLLTVTATSYNTVKTVTVPQVTAFATTTVASGGKLYKRQGIPSRVPLVATPIATAVADPIFTIFPSIAQNDSIAAEAYSACSCLHIVSSTVTAQPTIQFV